MALVTDAGLPGVSDPGARLIAAALDAGVPVTVLPGRVGGRHRARRVGARRRAVPVHRLPAAGRARRCGSSGTSSRAGRTPVVAFESPQRLPRTLRSLAAAMPERPIAVARELTKFYEEVVRGTAAEVAGALRGAAEGGDRARARAVRRRTVRPAVGRGSGGRGRRGARRGRACRAGGRPSSSRA